jgi:hypothetical protein
VYALGDMMIYNRRKRAEFFAEQKAKHAAAIHDARLAVQSGLATDAQIEFIKREDEHQARRDQEQREKTAKKGIFKTGRQWLFSGLKNEEEGNDVGTSERRLGYEALSEEDDGMGERDSDIMRAIEEKKMAIKEKTKKAFADEKERQKLGGPRDQLGTSPNDAGPGEESPKSGGWTSFITRR